MESEGIGSSGGANVAYLEREGAQAAIQVSYTSCLRVQYAMPGAHVTCHDQAARAASQAARLQNRVDQGLADAGVWNGAADQPPDLGIQDEMKEANAIDAITADSLNVLPSSPAYRRVLGMSCWHTVRPCAEDVLLTLRVGLGLWAG